MSGAADKDAFSAMTREQLETSRLSYTKFAADPNPMHDRSRRMLEAIDAQIAAHRAAPPPEASPRPPRPGSLGAGPGSAAGGHGGGIVVAFGGGGGGATHHAASLPAAPPPNTHAPTVARAGGSRQQQAAAAAAGKGRAPGHAGAPPPGTPRLLQL